MTTEIRFFSGTDSKGTLLFFAARTKRAMKRMMEETIGFTEWTVLTMEGICRELNPFIGPYFVSLVPSEFEARPEATVVVFPEEAMRHE
ncbi:MAG: hypothetical protein Q7R93_01955 [bacterium]|nr:hypothetical protein [bacterium]